MRRKDLTLEDAAALKAAIPEMRAVSPQRYLWDNTDYHVQHRDNEFQSPKVVGGVMEPPIALAQSRFVGQGRFLTELDVEHAADVMVIGDEIREKLFPREDPIDKRIQLGHDSYTVVGVFERKGKMFGESQDNFVVIPITTFDRRFPGSRPAAGTATRFGSPRSRSGPSSCRSSWTRPARCCARAGTCPSTSRTISGSSRRTR